MQFEKDGVVISEKPNLESALSHPDIRKEALRKVGGQNKSYCYHEKIPYNVEMTALLVLYHKGKLCKMDYENH